MYKQELVSKYSKEYEKNTVIFSEGDFGREMYVILKGEVQIYRMADGKKKVLATLGEGDMFGELALIDRFPRSAYAFARTDIVLLAINSFVFENLVSQNLDFAKKIIKLLASRIRNTNDIVLNIYYKDRESKVLSAINEFYKESLSRNEIKVKNKIEKQKFIDFCEKIKSMPTRVTEAQLVSLKKQGKLDYDIGSNIITLLDVNRRK